MVGAGLVTVQSADGFAPTLERLKQALARKSLTIFATFDHAAGAASVGLALPPNTVLAFGNPLAGTKLMQAVAEVGIDLPLKIQAWQDGDGGVHLTYNDPYWIAARHGLGEATKPVLDAMAALLGALVQEASKP